MSRKRQDDVIVCGGLPDPVTPMSHDFPGHHQIPKHLHPEHQLIYACRGVMTVSTAGGTWIVPPLRAVWIPAGTPHEVTIHGAVSMRTLYLKSRLVTFSRNCCVVSVSPLLRELILHACSLPALRRSVRSESHLIDLILDQLKVVEISPLHLVYPSDPRGVRVAEALSADPGDPRSLTAICEDAGASKRTVERIFLSETHLSLGQWRQQLRSYAPCAFWRRVKRSPAWPSTSATAHRAPSSPCSARRSAPRPASTSRIGPNADDDSSADASVALPVTRLHW